MEALNWKDLFIIITPFTIGIVGYFLRGILTKINTIEKDLNSMNALNAAGEKRFEGIEQRLKSMEHGYRDLQKELMEMLKNQKS